MNDKVLFKLEIGTVVNVTSDFDLVANLGVDFQTILALFLKYTRKLFREAILKRIAPISNRKTPRVIDQSKVI